LNEDVDGGVRDFRDQETQNHLIDGRDRKYFDAATCSRLLNLARAAERTTTRLLVAKLRQAAEEKRRRPAQRSKAPKSRHAARRKSEEG
jgi:hypothetical protein